MRSQTQSMVAKAIVPKASAACQATVNHSGREAGLNACAVMIAAASKNPVPSAVVAGDRITTKRWINKYAHTAYADAAAMRMMFWVETLSEPPRFRMLSARNDNISAQQA